VFAESFVIEGKHFPENHHSDRTQECIIDAQYVDHVLLAGGEIEVLIPDLIVQGRQVSDERNKIAVSQGKSQKVLCLLPQDPVSPAIHGKDLTPRAKDDQGNFLILFQNQGKKELFPQEERLQRLINQMLQKSPLSPGWDIFFRRQEKVIIDKIFHISCNSALRLRNRPVRIILQLLDRTVLPGDTAEKDVELENMDPDIEIDASQGE